MTLLTSKEGDVMYLKSIHIQNFRNYEKCDITFSPGINIIYGKNAQGKTNLLESIYVLGLTKSHRSFIDQNLIKEGESSSYLSGVLVTDSFENKLEVGFDIDKKKMKIDSSIVQKMGDYISKMNIIIFYPDDLELVKGSPNVRRRYLNTELSQLSSNYINLLNDYNKILKMRNSFLKKKNKKEEIDENYFAILTNYLVEKGVMIAKLRKKFLIGLNDNSEEIYKRITGNNDFHFVYKPNVEFDDYQTDEMKKKMVEKLEKMKETEIKLGTTLVGPHRDDFEFYLGDFNIKNYGSQGQQRVSILALKLAEIKLFENQRNTPPILLLDDVFSELDESKKSNLLTFIHSGIQTIITTTDLTNIDSEILKKAKKIEIDDAKIVKIEEVE